jgi:hypothetical protein
VDALGIIHYLSGISGGINHAVLQGQSTFIILKGKNPQVIHKNHHFKINFYKAVP